MRALGRDPASGETLPFDAGDRRYLDALYRYVQRPLVADGVDFWWLDWSGGLTTPSVPSLGCEAALNRLYSDETGSGGMPRREPRPLGRMGRPPPSDPLLR